MLLDEMNPDAHLIEGFEEAYLGLAEGWFEQHRNVVAVYDKEKCLQILVVREGLGLAEAEAFFQKEIIGVYRGAYMPMFFIPQNNPF